MATDKVVAHEKSPSRELLALLLSPRLPRTPLPDLEELKRILEICGEPKSKQERAGQ